MEKEIKGPFRPARASRKNKNINTSLEENDTNNNHHGTSSESDGEESCVLRKRNSHSVSSLLQTSPPAMAPKTFMNNLPYMGELTFDTRPRRGRKPKKADICHLISKNYGIQFPQAYVNEPNSRVNITPVSETPRSRVELSPTKDVSWSLISSPSQSSDEPLNLCLRDSSNSSTLTSGVGVPLSVSSPLFPISRSLINSIPSKSLLSSFNLSQGSSSGISSSKRKLPSAHIESTKERVKVLSSLREFLPGSTPQKDSLPANSPCSNRKRDATLVNQRQCSASNSKLTNTNKRKRAPIQAAQKRKSTQNHSAKCSQSPTNSGPPSIPTSQANTAQVSICKFKFTGGARPSLQEKKMLSVDSGGNFRFFSDKPCSLKQEESYESLATCSEDGGMLRVPKSAKAMSACMIPAFTSSSTFTEERGSGISSTANPDLSISYLPTPSQPDPDQGQFSTSSDEDNSGFQDSNTQTNANDCPLMKRKRRTRKSLVREKLEKTFKEKGFLIQTQQLESAEGATYCKFRQLRKFTRYLFRSWRDYLPENVKGLPGQNAGAASSGEQLPSPTAISLNESNQSSSSPIIKYEDDEQSEDDLNEQEREETDDNSDRESEHFT